MASTRHNIELTAKAKAGLQEIKAWSGLPLNLINQRVITFVASLDHDTQGVIIGALPRSRTPDFARLLLQELADAKPASEQREDRDNPADAPPDLRGKSTAAVDPVTPPARDSHRRKSG